LTRELLVRPRGPYSLSLSAGRAGDATRVFRDGVLVATVLADGRPERARAWQLVDGTVCLQGESDAAIERLRFCLAVDDDHSEFLRRFRDDPLLGRALRELRGRRPLRLATVAQALLRAFCGQLIESSRARALERRIVRASAVDHGAARLSAPPTSTALARFAPAELRRLGLHARRGAALVRICRELDAERLHGLTTAEVRSRLGRERGIGPWSLGVVCLEGLGRWDCGLVGDLGLLKLVSALRGRWADPAETAELLAPYGEWAGLASTYLLTAFGRGLIPLADAARARAPRFHGGSAFARA